MSSASHGASRVIALGYHDLAQGDGIGESGFRGPAAERYKLARAHFVDHLDAIATAVETAPVGAAELLSARRGAAWVLTFDDGGQTAMAIADLLEARGWRGQFFIATDRISADGFLTRAQLVELAGRGHGIGSHSCSHPPRMWSLPWERLLEEWRRSRTELQEILGRSIDSGAVPGGFYAPRVAQAAAAAGLRVLFTSEPVRRTERVGGCLVVGRFSMRRSTNADEAAALLAGRAAPVLRQWAAWQIKKSAKRVLGRTYEVIGRLDVRDPSMGRESRSTLPR